MNGKLVNTTVLIHDVGGEKTIGTVEVKQLADGFVALVIDNFDHGARVDMILDGMESEAVATSLALAVKRTRVTP